MSHYIYLFLPFLSKLIKSPNAVNSTIVSNLLDIVSNSTPCISQKVHIHLNSTIFGVGIHVYNTH